jgi:flagellar hook-basal body complex protein FliE
MSLDSVTFIPPGTDAQQLGGVERPGSDFGAWLDGQMNTLNQQIEVAEMEVRSLATGDMSNLHQVMISLEKANRSFQLVMQVRNKVLEAYQEIMRMQV